MPDPSLSHAMIQRIIRVNQAGELGAVRLYQGKLSVLGKTSAQGMLEEMEAHEAAHLEAFNRLAVERGVTPSWLSPLWESGGYALGKLTALMGEKAAHACTIAVEEVIEEHYAAQLALLPHQEDELRKVIAQCYAEETMHKNQAQEAGGYSSEEAPLLTSVIKTLARGAIWMAERL